MVLETIITYLTILLKNWLFVQILVGALLLGGIYALTATGFTMIFGVLKVLNIAHGEFVILGSYVAYWVFTLLGLDPLLAIGFTIAAGALYGLLAHVLVIDSVSRKGMEPTIVASFGILLVLQSGMLIAWTGDPRSIVTSYTGQNVIIGLFIIPVVRLIAFSVAVVSLLLLSIFLNRTYIGKAIRAVAQDAEASKLMGIPARSIQRLGFILGSMLAALSGNLIAMLSSFTPTLGPEFLLKSFVILAIVGFGNVREVVIGGLILGVVESFGSFFLGTGMRNVIAYALLIIILLLRPQGLFGHKMEVREV